MDTQSERDLQILEYLERNPDTTQADLATRLGVAVGSVNWYLKRLIGKGYVKVRQMQRRRLRYLITPQGVAEKARLTRSYMEVSLRLYRETRAHARRLLAQVLESGYDTVRIEGDGDLAEICLLTCLEQGVKIELSPDESHLPTLAVTGVDLCVHWPGSPKLTADNAVNQLERSIVGITIDIPEISLVYVFGSQIEGDVGPLSDYDLGVLLDNTASWPQIRAQLGHKLMEKLEAEQVDLVLLNDAPVELAYAIIAQGNVLYQRDVASRVEYEARVMSLYGDYLPILRVQQRDILQGSAYETRVQRYRATLRRTERALSQAGTAQGEDTIGV